VLRMSNTKALTMPALLAFFFFRLRASPATLRPCLFLLGATANDRTTSEAKDADMLARTHIKQPKTLVPPKA